MNKKTGYAINPEICKSCKNRSTNNNHSSDSCWINYWCNYIFIHGHSRPDKEQERYDHCPSYEKGKQKKVKSKPNGKIIYD